jgi:hypothetical protein
MGTAEHRRGGRQGQDHSTTYDTNSFALEVARCQAAVRNLVPAILWWLIRIGFSPVADTKATPSSGPVHASPIKAFVLERKKLVAAVGFSIVSAVAILLVAAAAASPALGDETWCCSVGGYARSRRRRRPWRGRGRCRRARCRRPAPSGSRRA